MKAKFVDLDHISISIEGSDEAEKIIFQNFVKLIDSNKSKLNFAGSTSRSTERGLEHTHIMIRLEHKEEVQ